MYIYTLQLCHYNVHWEAFDHLSTQLKGNMKTFFHSLVYFCPTSIIPFYKNLNLSLEMKYKVVTISLWY